MNDKSGQSASIWMSQDVPAMPPIVSGAHADVCIVGAGIAGLTTTYCLMKEGKSIILLDAGQPGGGMTQRTTAHLSNALDDRYVEIERLHGKTGAQLAAHSHTAAIDWIDKVRFEERIECDFTRLDGYLFAPSDDARHLIEEEWQAARRAGVEGVERLDRLPGNMFETGPCLRFPRQAQFHPLKYVSGLLKAIRAGGGRVFSNAHVTSVDSDTPIKLETSQGSVVTADAVVIATNTPINNLLTIHTKQAAYISYVIGATIPSRIDRTGIILGYARPVSLCANSSAGIGSRGGAFRPHRGRRGPQGRTGRRRRSPLCSPGGVGARAFSHDERRRISVVRTSHGVGGRPGLHRPEPGRYGQYLHRNRRLRYGHDPWHNCRTADHRSHYETRVALVLAV
jgi:glycine/D-amino acid oxidase-like deaminating enzyme